MKNKNIYAELTPVTEGRSSCVSTIKRSQGTVHLGRKAGLLTIKASVWQHDMKLPDVQVSDHIALEYSKNI